MILKVKFQPHPLGGIERSCIPAMEVVDEQSSRRLKNSSFQETVLKKNHSFVAISVVASAQHK